MEVVKIEHTEMLMGSNDTVRTIQTNLDNGDGLNYVGSDAEYSDDAR